jgi:UDP-N-acetylglucosamine diphosphorylase/glucosamine-1-phosphate N-acetyltransferase
MHVVIFEGTRWHTFAPLSLSRPVFMLKTGMGTLLDKQIRHLRPKRLSLWVRPELESYVHERVVPKLDIPTTVNQPLDDEPALLVSGRTVHFAQYEYPPQPGVCTDNEGQHVRSAYVHMPGLAHHDVAERTDRWLEILDLPHMMQQSRMVETLWDLISWNEESLVEDAMQYVRSAGATAAAKGKPSGKYHLVRDDEVFLGADVKLCPGAVLDASKGPVVVDHNATIGANSVLYGPCYVGPYAEVRAVSLIRPGTSIGIMSKVGGEVSNSIVLGYSNKAHDGYLGDSYVGKWVNLGAGTTTSNLKNTYGEITMDMGKEKIPTGRRRLGALIGDHTKTAILTRLMTGTYVGFCSMLADSGTPPRFVPSYTFWTERGPEPYKLDKAIEVTQRVFARRDRGWTETDERIMRYVAEAAPGVEGTTAR